MLSIISSLSSILSSFDPLSGSLFKRTLRPYYVINKLIIDGRCPTDISIMAIRIVVIQRITEITSDLTLKLYCYVFIWFSMIRFATQRIFTDITLRHSIIVICRDRQTNDHCRMISFGKGFIMNNTSIEQVIGNVINTVTTLPGNRLVVSRNQVTPTPHPLIDYVQGVDYTDTNVLDVFQHYGLLHTHLNEHVHGFSITRDAGYRGEIIWCTGIDHQQTEQINDLYMTVSALLEVEQRWHHLEVLPCSRLYAWDGLLPFIKAQPTALLIGCVGRPDVVYRVGANLHQQTTLKQSTSLPFPKVFQPYDPTDLRWFIYTTHHEIMLHRQSVFL